MSGLEQRQVMAYLPTALMRRPPWKSGAFTRVLHPPRPGSTCAQGEAGRNERRAERHVRGSQARGLWETEGRTQGQEVREMQTAERSVTTGSHPLDPLSAGEMETAAATLRAEGRLH